MFDFLWKKNSLPSKTAFWFSVTMFNANVCVAVTVFCLCFRPNEILSQSIGGIVGLVSVPAGILATAYTWSKSKNLNPGNQPNNHSEESV